MKLLLLLLFPVLSIAQNKKDNAILIPANGITQSQIINAFVTSGYGIDKSTDGYYSTTAVSKKNASIKMDIYLQGSVYILRGWLDANLTINTGFFSAKSSFEQISYIGMKGSVYRNTWDELVNVASKIGKEFTYAKMK